MGLPEICSAMHSIPFTSVDSQASPVTPRRRRVTATPATTTTATTITPNAPR